MVGVYGQRDCPIQGVLQVLNKRPISHTPGTRTQLPDQLFQAESESSV